MKDFTMDGAPQIPYFIDESGNTGDLTLGGDTLSFGEQPYFGLGCIGIKISKNLAPEFQISKIWRANRRVCSAIYAEPLSLSHCTGVLGS